MLSWYVNNIKVSVTCHPGCYSARISPLKIGLVTALIRLVRWRPINVQPVTADHCFPVARPAPTFTDPRLACATSLRGTSRSQAEVSLAFCGITDYSTDNWPIIRVATGNTISDIVAPALRAAICRRGGSALCWCGGCGCGGFGWFCCSRCGWCGAFAEEFFEWRGDVFVDGLS